MAAAEKDDLDRTDRSILCALQKDGRMSNALLAETVHLSPAACLERVRRLVERDYIMGYVAILNPQKLKVGMLLYIHVILETTRHETFENFKASVQARSEILECHMIAGDFDYLLKVRVRDMQHYREFVADSIWAMHGVRQTHTFTVMEEIKETHELPVR